MKKVQNSRDLGEIYCSLFAPPGQSPLKNLYYSVPGSQEKKQKKHDFSWFRTSKTDKYDRKAGLSKTRGAYFVNRHDTFWKELNFNFPEHQNFLKFIKNSLRKSKKSENILKKSRFFENFENFHNFRNFLRFFLNTKSYWKSKILRFWKFWKLWNFRKNMIFSKHFQIFSFF